MGKLEELAAADLRRACDPQSFDFDTTASLPRLGEVLRQPRAVAAFEFGVRVASHGFNLFALGLPGSGKTTLIREYLERRASTQPAPPDLCYVHNFSDGRSPVPLHLPPGQAVRFRHDVAALVEDLRAAIPRAFDTAEYADHRDGIVHQLDAEREKELAQLDQRVTRVGFQLLKGPGGLVLAPAVEGRVLGEQELEKLSPEQVAALAKIREGLQHQVEASLRAIRGMEKVARDAMRALDTETAAFAIRHLIDELRARHRDQAAVLRYLDALEADVIAHADDFRKSKEETPPPASERQFARYKVNVLVDNGSLRGSPVVVETNPTYHNLTGRIEHQATMGEAYTDHTMIKAGALHRARGGYLIVPARECMLLPFAWDGLKRALKDRELHIEELGTQLNMVSTVTLAPEPVPLDVKVVLIGSPQLYYQLYAYDEDFQKLFKVKADFTTRMDRTPESEHAYALFVSTITQGEKTLPFDRGAVARVVEYGSRAAEDQDQLSTRFGDIADLIREAAHRAGQNCHGAVNAEDVRAAEDARRYRQSLTQERLQESMVKGTVLLDIAGEAVGRINGLSVVDMGDYAFGHPVRLTATVGPGRRGVVSIEREVEMSGPIHGKGVLILSGYLLRKYGHAGPLSLSASLVFEQSYSLVEGDSASLAELCVLLSAVAGAPLRQDIAVTGSVNQHGQVQPVGGVTEKIEGFFDLCRARGLTGSQGVLIPAANRRHVMLRDDVVEAVRAGRFHLWTAEEVEDALDLLTGLPHGEPDASGVYPDGSLHRRVSERLARYSEMMRALAAEEKASGKSAS